MSGVWEPNTGHALGTAALQGQQQGKLSGLPTSDRPESQQNKWYNRAGVGTASSTLYPSASHGTMVF